MNVAIRIRYRVGSRILADAQSHPFVAPMIGVGLPQPRTRRERELAEYSADLLQAARVLDRLQASAELAGMVARRMQLGVDVDRMAADDVLLAARTAEGCRYFAVIGMKGLQR